MNEYGRWNEMLWFGGRGSFSLMLMHMNLSQIKEKFFKLDYSWPAKNQKVGESFLTVLCSATFCMGGKKKAVLKTNFQFSRISLSRLLKCRGNYQNLSSTKIQLIGLFCQVGWKPSVYQVLLSAQEGRTSSSIMTSLWKPKMIFRFLDHNFTWTGPSTIMGNMHMCVGGICEEGKVGAGWKAKTWK